MSTPTASSLLLDALAAVPQASRVPTLDTAVREAADEFARLGRVVRHPNAKSEAQAIAAASAALLGDLRNIHVKADAVEGYWPVAGAALGLAMGLSGAPPQGVTRGV